MSDRTAISWCDSTFNPWIGCTKVSPACDHCYAEAMMDKRWKRVQWGAGKPRARTNETTWRTPLYWNSRHEDFMQTHGRRRRVFCASLADVFDNEVSPVWRADLFALIKATPHLDWLLLTKRIGAVRNLVCEALWQDGAGYARWPWPNVWLGATVCNQEEADRDIPKLLAIPARVRFLSIEPMLGPISLRWLPAWPENAPAIGQRPDQLSTNELDGLRRLDWVICGGESGPQARPMHPDWVRSLRDQCFDAGVPFHFKQWGEWLCCETEASTDFNGRAVYVDEGFGATLPERGLRVIQVNGAEFVHVGTKAAGRVIDGLEHNGFPAA